MSGPNLRQIALMIVAERQPMSPYDLIGTLQRDFGASHADANRTFLELVRDGQLQSGLHGVTLRAQPTHDSHNGQGLGTVASVLGIVAALLTIWEIAARTDVISIQGPVEWVQAAMGTPEASPSVRVPNVVGQDVTAATQNVSARGLSAQPQPEPNESVPLGQVLRTDPPAGTRVPRGSTVVLYFAVFE
jgi:PASTA domain